MSSMNTFGRYFRLTTFGESHGPAIGGVVDGMPAGVNIDPYSIALAMQCRKSVAQAGGTARIEQDDVEILSGVWQGVSTGSPIAFVVRNNDARSADYSAIADKFRPNHADYTWSAKYGVRDPRGGGRASARETACRVAAGALANMLISRYGVKIMTWTSRIGEVEYHGAPSDEDEAFRFASRCPDPDADSSMLYQIQQALKDCDSLGGIVSCCISGLPVGLGEPLANKFQAELAAAMMSIPAARGFEYGDGFAAAASKGSLQCDEYYMAESGIVKTRTNHSGGIQGGITNGMPVYFRVAFKPVATLPGRILQTIDKTGQPCSLEAKGRHDACVVPRAVAVVQAMARLVVADAILASRLQLDNRQSE